MAERGGQPGNQNAKKSRMFEQALVRAIKQRDLETGQDGETLRLIADVLVTKATAGDRKCAMDIRDTLDGKPAQMLIGDADNPLVFQEVERKIVDPQA
jgi:hypothetical protein